MNTAFSANNDERRPITRPAFSAMQTLEAAARLRRFSRGEIISEPGATSLVGCVVEGTVKLVT